VIRNTAFGKILDIAGVEINNHLITTLVERWRPETHTFHLPIGECTITLEDVAYQIGLPIDGDVVTGPTNMDWNVVCHNLLGAVPTDRQIVGQQIQMSWLDSTFQQLPDDVTEIVIDQHARAFILRMIGGFLMPDTSVSRVHLMYLLLLEDLSETYQYSWGSAVLVCLYRGLCRAALISHQIEIGECLLLLQSWVYNRIPMFAPRLNDNTTNLFPLVRRWSQHLVTTNIHGHATNIIQSMLDRLRIDQYKFIRSIRDQCAPSNLCHNPMQTLHGVYLQCNEMLDVFAKLLPTAFSDSNYQAPLTHHFDMPIAPEFQQPFESQTQTNTHPQAFTQQTSVPQQQPFQFQSFGALSDYSISHQFGSSSHYQETLSSMFGTTSNTPLSAFNSQQYYQPTMPTQVEQGNIYDEDDEDDDEEDEEVSQLVRGGTRQSTQPNLRVQPPRMRKPPPCGTSSHRRH
ncbi:hypothetical protein Lal_00018517, partial [Lupinus albus]